jgi:hypothetical protein
MPEHVHALASNGCQAVSSRRRRRRDMYYVRTMYMHARQ